MTCPPRSSCQGYRGLSVLAALTLSALFIGAPLRADDVFQAIGEEVRAIFDKTKVSVVQVQSGDGDVMLSGTGFFIDSNGTVLTSSTVVGDNNTSVRVSVNGEFVAARIVGNDPRSGLAELQVADNGSIPLSFGQSTDMKTGFAVIAVGFPLNLPAAPSQGLVSGFDVRYMNQFFATTPHPRLHPHQPGAGR